MSGFFGGGAHRCSSMLFTKPGDKASTVRCNLDDQHRGSHHGRTPAGIFLRWTDAEARESRRLPVEKRVGELTAWRAWHINELGFLASTAAALAWEGPLMTTRPRSDGRGLRRVTSTKNIGRGNRILSETTDLDHGVFAYKTPEELTKYFRPHPSYTYGRVGLTGHVVEHELGYRAQKCMVRGLWILTALDVGELEEPIGGSKKAVKEAMESRYRCPVHFLNNQNVRSWASYYTKEGEDE